MSREAVVASMANKLAEGQFVFKSKRKFAYNKIIPVIAAGVLLTGGLIWNFSRKNSGEESVPVKSLDSVMITRNPLYKLKGAFIDHVINADYYALCLKDMLTRYDSVPEVYRIAGPVINPEDVYSELNDIWVKVSPGIRFQITRDLPQFTFKQQDRYDGTK